MTALLIGLVLAAASPACAQFVPPRAEVGPESFGPKERKAPAPRRAPPLPFAQVLYERWPASEWEALSLSTSAPKEQMSAWMRQGTYRGEIVLLVLAARKGKANLTELMKRREKGDSLRAIAESLGEDYLALRAEADVLKEELDLAARPLEEKAAVEASSAPARSAGDDDGGEDFEEGG